MWREHTTLLPPPRKPYVEECRGSGGGGGHIPPGESGMVRAVSSSPEASPGRPAAKEASSQAGPGRLPPGTCFLWGLAHSPGSICPDLPPRPPTYFLLRAMTMGCGSPTLSISVQLYHFPRPPPWWPQWAWLPGQPQIAVAGPLCGQSRKAGITLSPIF